MLHLVQDEDEGIRMEACVTARMLHPTCPEDLQHTIPVQSSLAIHYSNIFNCISTNTWHNLWTIEKLFGIVREMSESFNSQDPRRYAQLVFYLALIICC